MTVRTHGRPDGRLVALPTGRWTRALARDAAALAQRDGHTVITTVDDDATTERAALEAAGFRVARTEVVVEIAIPAALDALAEAQLPAGVLARRADEVDPDRLRRLDDALRQDVPGTEGWHSTPERFAEDTFEDPGFDPTTYLVAVSADDEEPIGIVRIWMNRSGPRIGLWGVVRSQRRRGIAAALLSQALEAARRRGAERVTTEYDESNQASAALAARLGARPVGRIVELAFDPHPVAGTPSGGRAAGREGGT